jgi:hypothetical protein
MTDRVLPIVRTQWRVEHRGNGRWVQIGFPVSLSEAWELFERAVADYPADGLIRLMDGDQVLKVTPATWCWER